MLPIKNLFGFRKNKGLDKSIIQKNPYRNNTDLNKRQFIKKGLLGMAGLGGLALASKVAKAGGLVFNDGSTQAAGSLEGTSIKSTSETGGTKFLREDGDGSCSWQAADIIKGGDIASASPLVIDTDGSYFNVTGTAGFAAMTVAADRQFTLQFDGALTMTHHATNLDLPGEANITTAAGDVATFQSTGSNTVQCINYTRADGSGIVAGGIDGWAANGANNDLLPASASAGIYLGVSSATAANLLDDYEEGTWTVAVTGQSSGSWTVGGGETTGAYTKIGRNVFINGQLNITGESSPSGQILVSLPFTTASLTETSDGSAITIMIQSHGGSFNQPTGFTQQGEAYFRLWSVEDDGTLSVLGAADVDTSWTIQFGGHFQTDS